MVKTWEYLMGQFSLVGLSDILDVLVVAFIIRQAIILVRETRALQLVKGLAALGLIYLVSYVLRLKTMTFIMRNILQIGAVALLVVFQPELRRALEQVGRARITGFGFLGGLGADRREQQEQWQKAIAAIKDAVASLSRQKTGALMVLERETPLGDVVKTGTIVDADPSPELIGNLFFVNSPLHDGAVIIRGGRILAAGCFLPLSDNFTISKELGTRHRAALGMSENSDAVIVIVSEETGAITLAQDGKLRRWVTPDQVEETLRGIYLKEPEQEPGRLTSLLGSKKKSEGGKS